MSFDRLVMPPGEGFLSGAEGRSLARLRKLGSESAQQVEGRRLAQIEESLKRLPVDAIE
jgi:hypothetical protein